MTSVASIDVSTARRRLDRGHALLVDVREPDEYAKGHAPGAVLMPLAEIGAERLPVGVDLMMICRSGNRSSKAVQRLGQAGRSALNVDGGMTAWQQAGLPVETDDGSPGQVA